ncbi:MAG TPA: 6-bladed beta-propeller [Niabella sp.]|nr:6-bladed beta-propeller [Niabella sp.]HQX21093.1 6-bladed beta-propeller [Niabella sp.]HRB51876.1 6-bladed beta-propeller [Niabella sp.]HRC05993.1 6-bladed beta-propeller [Niabella sp.]HRC22317.1 6-bladed beta-propeller [Niabella sp.]
MRLILLIISVVSFTVGNTNAQQDIKLRLDLEKAYGGSISDYFDHIEYIPLETTKESLFGQTSTLLVADTSFVIWDEDTRAILFFSKQGKYIKKINVPQNIYPSLYTENRGTIIVILYSDYQKNKVQKIYYSSSGDETMKEKSLLLPFNEFKYFLPLEGDYVIKPNSCYFNIGEKPNEQDIFLLNVFKKDELVKSFIPYNQKKNMASCTLGLGKLSITRNTDFGSSSFFVTTPLDYNVYVVNKDTAIKAWQFVFRQNEYVDKEILTSLDHRYIDSLRKTRWFKDITILGVNNIFKFSDKLLFKIERVMYYSSESSEANKQNNFIYKFKTGKLTSYERMTPDTSCYYLPLFDKAENFHKLGFSKEKDFFYTSISSLKMFAARNATKHRNPQYPPALQQYFKTQNRKSNPVIVRMKLKEGD